jgi:hypothetical protein
MATPRRHRILTGLFLGAALATGLVAVPVVGAATPTTSTPSTPPSAAPVTSTPVTSTPAVPGGALSAPLCIRAVVTLVRRHVESELAARVIQLETLVTRVHHVATLTSSDRATLLADLTKTELPGLRRLETKVPGDTTCPELRQDAHSMIYDFRVYLVMTPQTDLVIADDATLHAESVFSDLEAVASHRIQSASAQGTEVSGAEAALSDYQTRVTAAQGLTSGQSAALLAQTPQGYPGTRLVFGPARANVLGARNDLRAARNDLALIVHSLG